MPSPGEARRARRDLGLRVHAALLAEAVAVIQGHPGAATAEHHPTSGRAKTGPADAKPLDRADRDPKGICAGGTVSEFSR
jgi:hypothetical protein